jgi:hypothetical protein
VIRNGWSYILGGRWWAGWGYGWRGPAYWSFMRDVVGLEFNDNTWEKAAAWEYMMSAGWLWPHREFVMVCELPTQIHLEREKAPTMRWKRLHNESGAAVVWADGTALWFVRGMRVTQQLVESPETITAEQIKSERNAEIRRFIIDKFGAARYLRTIGAVVVHEDLDQHGFRRRLLRADLAGDVESLVMVEVVNASPEPIGYEPGHDAAGVWLGNRWFRTYTLRVPPAMQTTGEAIAWTFSRSAEAYAPAIET